MATKCAERLPPFFDEECRVNTAKQFVNLKKAQIMLTNSSQQRTLEIYSLAP